MEELQRIPRYVDQEPDGAWVKYILDFKMPNIEKEDEVKQEVINELRPIMNTAPRGNYDNFDIDNLLWAYDDTWQKYFIYSRGRYDKDLIQLRDKLRMCFKMELSEGKNFGLMGMMMQPKQTFVQKLIRSSRSKSRLFRGRKEEHEELEEEMT